MVFPMVRTVCPVETTSAEPGLNTMTTMKINANITRNMNTAMAVTVRTTTGYCQPRRERSALICGARSDAYRKPAVTVAVESRAKKDPEMQR